MSAHDTLDGHNGDATLAFTEPRPAASVAEEAPTGPAPDTATEAAQDLDSGTDPDAGAAAETGKRPGTRLVRVEVYNWGTYDQTIWTFPIDGANALLTGAIGSGKSTVVDAITTLLMPPNKIAYNKASGADTTERDLRSYFLGTYSATRSDTDNRGRAVHLRPHGTHSVLLAVFRNDHSETMTTLAQVFWLPDGDTGQPKRFHVVAASDLSIGDEFVDFDHNIANLKARLRKSGHDVSDHFPDYGTAYRRALGITSEQAVALFHQTVSMKAVADLNEFVRSHMLEPLDLVGDIEKIISHFDDLSRAHEAVREARAKIEQLQPVLALCDEYDEIAEVVSSATRSRQAVDAFRADHAQSLLAAEAAELDAHVAAADRQLEKLDGHLAALDDTISGLRQQRDGLGGARLKEIEGEVGRLTTELDDRNSTRRRMNEVLTAVQLPAVESADQFERRRVEIALLQQANDGDASVQASEIESLTIKISRKEDDAKVLNSELLSLRDRPTNIPSGYTRLREDLCRELGVTGEDLPFAGELLQIRESERAWEGAAERLLYSFATSLLVPEELYAAIAARVNARHLGLNLTYLRVPDRVVADEPGQYHSDAPPMWTKLDVKDGRFRSWSERELTRVARHACVNTIEEFRRLDFAVTQAGQTKGRSQHRKNDRYRIDDREHYVLGWNNALKIAALIERAQTLHTDITALREARAELAAQAQRRQAVLVKLATIDFITRYTQIDVAACGRRIAELSEEKQRLEASTPQLEQIAADLADGAARHTTLTGERDTLVSTVGGLKENQRRVQSATAREQRILDQPEHAAHQQWFAEITLILSEDGQHPLDTVDQCTSSARRAYDLFTARIETLTEKRRLLTGRITRGLERFRSEFPLDTQELDASIEAVSEYRALYATLEHDKLPQFEETFKQLLNTNAIRDIATLNATLNREESRIKQRIDIINASLAGIDYQAGVSYIEVVTNPTQDVVIREFRDSLRACLEGTVGSGVHDDLYTEDKFLQVKGIVERFKGRPGQLDQDKIWTRKVTDVRGWFEFSASELRRTDDSEIEHYTGSSGKSGGQKEKLAYTILAAALAYQFGLDPEGDPAEGFRFIVIDEAFGRGDEKSTEYALNLFATLGLQVLVATPLQKIHVIAGHVERVGYVDNVNQQFSRLHAMTIEQYRAEVARVRTAAHAPHGAQ